MRPRMALAQQFVDGKIDADTFADQYIDLYYAERNKGHRSTEIEQSLFVIADTYCLMEFRKNGVCDEGELDEHELMLYVSVFVRHTSSVDAYREIEETTKDPHVRHLVFLNCAFTGELFKNDKQDKPMPE